MNNFQPLARLTSWRSKIVKTIAVKRLLIAGTVCMGLAAAVTEASDTQGMGVLLLDMSKANITVTTEDFIHALKLRLSGWTVRQVKPDTPETGRCDDGDDHLYLLRIETTSGGRIIAELLSCADGATLFREQMDESASEQDALRRVAVLTPLALEVDERVDEGDVPADVSSAKHDTDMMTRKRLMGTMGLAPGLTIAPTSGNVVFTGHGEMGLLFVNGLAVQFGVDGSSPQTGVAVKKNKAPSEGARIGVTDIGFGFGALFRFELGRRWYMAFGLGVRYVHAITRNLTEDKFKIEEPHPASRGGGTAMASGGIMVRRWVSVSVALFPTIFFGKRTYTVRGTEAVNLGYGTIGLAFGVRFYL